jgi:hypothetical protein
MEMVFWRRMLADYRPRRRIADEILCWSGMVENAGTREKEMGMRREKQR